jgi:hypothetical protein
MISPSLENKKAELSHCRPGERTFLGAEAQHEISQRLSGFPLAQQLSREIYDFYGDHLVYIESSNFSSTIFTLRLQHQPILIESAEIQVRLGTDRVAEALAHELLHLRLFILGFPLGEFIQIPFPFVHYAQDFIGMCHWVLNIVQHEMNYQSFIALGFDKNHFLVRSEEVIDYRSQLRPEFQNQVPAELDFPRWCIEYMRHFFAARHGGDGDSLDQAQDALAWGSRIYPQLRLVTAEIRKWFEMGIFKDPAKYPSQVNSLLELMGIPKFTGWALLEPSASRMPIAVCWEGKSAKQEAWQKSFTSSQNPDDKSGGWERHALDTLS